MVLLFFFGRGVFLFVFYYCVILFFYWLAWFFFDGYFRRRLLFLGGGFYEGEIGGLGNWGYIVWLFGIGIIGDIKGIICILWKIFINIY